MENLEIGSLNIEPGTKKSGFLKVATRYDGSEFGIPVIVINGSEEGPILCVDGGMDGNEMEGSLAILEITDKLDPRKLKGAYIAIPVLNVPACLLEARDAGVFDLYGGNMSTSFAGPRGITTRIANTYYRNCVSKADYLISHHSGGNVIYDIERVVYNESVDESAKWAKAMGPEWIILQKSGASPGNLFGSCAERGIPSLIIELGGGGGRLPEILKENVNKLVEMDFNAMRHLGMIEGEPKYAEEWIIAAGGHGIYSGAEGFIKYTCKMGTEIIPKGTPLAKVVSFLGEEVETITAPWDGVVMGLRTHYFVHPGDQVLSFGKVVKG